jgi:GNAT superfamily N-acetyltransferase
MTVTLQVARHGAEVVPGMRDDLLAVHEDAHGELLDQPFYSTERFWERFENYSQHPSFVIATGRVDDALVGYAFGSALSADTTWWRGVQEAENADLTRETGHRTFAFREFLVRKSFQGKGFGHQLHNALLAGRTEERATLLVRSDNPARALYLRWGWSQVAYLQPFADSPRFELMIKRLRADAVAS